MSIKKIAIRTEGDFSAGLGHIARCLVLAEEFKKNNIEVVFFIKKNKVVEKLIQESGFQLFLVEVGQPESKYISKILSNNKIDLIILDTFEATEQYVEKFKKEMRGKCFVVILDNLRIGKISADVLINGSIYAQSWYSQRLNDNSYLLGPKYTILQSAYKEKKVKNIEEKARKILITMGGTDPKKLTREIALLLLSIKEIKLTILVGKGFEDKNELTDLFAENPRVELVFDSTNIKPYLENCDVAVTAGGTTTYETAALGIPSAIFLQAENQELPARIFHEKQLMINFGYYIKKKDGFYLKRFQELFINQNERQQMNNGLQNLVDGNGTKRILKKISLLYNNWSEKYEFK